MLLVPGGESTSLDLTGSIRPKLDVCKAGQRWGSRGGAGRTKNRERILGHVGRGNSRSQQAWCFCWHMTIRVPRFLSFSKSLGAYVVRDKRVEVGCSGTKVRDPKQP